MPLVDLSHQRDHHALDRLMKPERVLDAVIEPLAVAEGVLDIILEARLVRHLDAQGHHPVEQVIEGLAVVQPAGGG